MLIAAAAVGSLFLLIEILGSVGGVLNVGIPSAAVAVFGHLLAGVLVFSLWLAPFAYLATVLTRSLVTVPDIPWVRLGLGLALAFSASHLCGVLGLFGPALRLTTTLVWLAGAGGAGYAYFRASGPFAVWFGREPLPARTRAIHPLYLLAIPALAVLLLAASQPPGWLWGSEYGAFDSLSYHLQLPQEWLAMGRMRPLSHNVYSYLPGYMEAVFMQVGAGAEALDHLANGTSRPGLFAFGGEPLIVCQMLHALLAILAAAFTAKATATVAGPSGAGSFASAVAFLIVITTPWVLVTGSLSYNECAVLALFAAAMLTAAQPALSPRVATCLAAVMIGVACGCKPTAMLFCVAPVAVLLLRRVPRTELLGVVALAAVCGLASLLPWMLRNYLASHNPIFPEASGLFGTGDWTAEQIARYSRAHHFEGTLGERVGLLFSRERGLVHRQFGLLGIGMLASVAGLGTRAVRPLAVLIAAGIATQLIAWSLATHLQSRFLIPIVIPAGIAIGLCVHGLNRAVAARIAAGVFSIIQAGFCVVLYIKEHPMDSGSPIGSPNLLLHAGSGYFDGAAFVQELRTMSGSEKKKFLDEQLGPESFLQLTTPPDRSLLLLGDATPLYFGPVQYATTWDAPVVFNIHDLKEHPERVAESLASRGISKVLVNFAELQRYQESGFGNPELTAANLELFLKAYGRPVKAWPALSRNPYQVLFELQGLPVTKDRTGG